MLCTSPDRHYYLGVDKTRFFHFSGAAKSFSEGVLEDFCNSKINGSDLYEL